MAGAAEYVSVSRALARVRRAWKRTSALSGLVLVLIEALGIVTVLILVDVLYHPGREGRAALLVLAVAGVAYFIARHVVRPVALSIPDEQIALYIEERNPGFEGALMSAAEFAPRAGASDKQGAIIEAIVDEAVRRAKAMDLRSAVDLTRLRKYGVAALGLLAVYLLMGVIAPKAARRHASRVLMPWQEAPGERASGLFTPDAELPPIEIALSAGDTRLLRGSRFELEAGLSRAPEKPVLFHFMPVADIARSDLRGGDAGGDDEDGVPVLGGGGAGEDGPGAARRRLPMEEVEKLHGYRIVLPDVNEDMLFRVTTGEYRSGTHRITVYDPLKLAGFRVRVRFPEYMGLADHVAEQPTGDVAAPEGSTVTARIMTNGVLEGGKLSWSDGEMQELEVTGGGRRAAEAAFEVLEDRTYNFVIRDIDGQEATNEAPILVHAIRDVPPRLEVKSPKIDISTHPLGEVEFLAEARDDWALDSVELVYRAIDTGGAAGAPGAAPGRTAGAPKRVKLAVEPHGPGGEGAVRRGLPTGTTWADATLRLLLEELDPRPKPQELITYHIEARDRKGQKAISDIYMLTVTPFELWGTWLPIPFEEGIPHGGTEYVPEPVAKYLAAVWHLEAQKEFMPRDEFEAACRKLAEKFVKEGTTLWEYVRTPPKRRR